MGPFPLPLVLPRLRGGGGGAAICGRPHIADPDGGGVGGDCRGAGGIPAAVPARAHRPVPVPAGLFPADPDTRLAGAGRLVRAASVRRRQRAGG